MLSDEAFAEIRDEWNDTLERTNIFLRPDSAPPKLLAPRDSCATLAGLVVDIANFSGIPVRQLVGPSRHKEISRWRQLGYYAGMRDLKKTSTQVGAVFGRDHSTVLSGAKKFHELSQMHPEWLDRYEKIALGLQ